MYSVGINSYQQVIFPHLQVLRKVQIPWMQPAFPRWMGK